MANLVQELEQAENKVLNQAKDRLKTLQGRAIALEREIQEKTNLSQSLSAEVELWKQELKDLHEKIDGLLAVIKNAETISLARVADETSKTNDLIKKSQEERQLASERVTEAVKQENVCRDLSKQIRSLTQETFKQLSEQIKSLTDSLPS